LIGDVGQTKEDELYKYWWNLDWYIYNFKYLSF
jgi:hypothetical protein